MSDEVIPEGRVGVRFEDGRVVITHPTGATPEEGEAWLRLRRDEYRKTATVWATQVPAGGTCDTPEGPMTFEAGDYLVTDNPPTHVWPVRRDYFERSHVGVNEENDE